MILRPADQDALKRLGLPFKVSWLGGFITVQIEDYPLGPGLLPEKVTILVRLPPEFPDVYPDMFWVDPPVRRPSEGLIAGTQYMETHPGRQWQRWSRHVIHNWRPGIDNLSTYLAYVRRCFDQEKAVGAAHLRARFDPMDELCLTVEDERDGGNSYPSGWSTRLRAGFIYLVRQMTWTADYFTLAARTDCITCQKS